MNEQAGAIAKKRIVYEVAVPVKVRGDIELAGGVSVDVYEPETPSRGTVLIVSGYRDRGLQSFLGCRYKEMGWAISWGDLLAASGVTAITYSAEDPLQVHDVLQQIGAGALPGVAAERVGLLACSGNGPMAMSLLRHDALRCAALLYAYTMDVDGASAVAEASKQFHFVNPGAAGLREDVPIFLARAGRDETPGLNAALDSFVAFALRRNMPLTLANYAAAPHAFDLFVDAPETREVIRHVLAFFAARL